MEPALKESNKAQKESSALKVIPLGGLGEIGLNMMVFEYEDDIILIDCGLMFPEEHMLGIDIVIPDISYLRSRAKQIKGIIITHGHEDHTGALPFVLQEIKAPIYGTKLTVGLIKEKLKEFDLIKKTKLTVVNPGEKIKLGAFKVEFIRVTHSVADGVGLAITTPVGTIIHTGDFKFDQTPVDGKTTDVYRFAEHGDKGVLALLSDSTNVENEGYTLSEKEIGVAFDDIFSKATGRIIIAAFSSNIHRMQQVIDAAYKHNRKLILTGKSMIANFKIAHELGYITVPKNVITELSQLHKLSKYKTVILTTGSQGEPMSVLTRIALDDHNKIKIEKGDVVVLSSKFIPGNEKTIANIINNLYKRGANVIYEKVSEVHVSGHASQEELKLMINLTKPRYFIPIHGEYRHLVQHCNLAKKTGIRSENTLLAQDGDVITFTKESVKITGTVYVGKVFIDGKGVGDVGDLVIRDRKHLSQDGMIIALLVISKVSAEIIYGPEILSAGVMLEEESKEIVEQAKFAIVKALSEINPEAKRDFAEVKMEVRKCLRRLFNKKLERRPVIFPIIVEI